MSLTFHSSSLLTSTFLSSGYHCYVVKSVSCLHSTKTWNTEWTIFLWRDVVSVCTQMLIYFDKEEKVPAIYGLIFCRVGLSKFCYCSAILDFPCWIGMCYWLLCQIAFPSILARIRGIWWSWIGLLQSVSVVPWQLGYIACMMDSCRTWGFIHDFPSTGTLLWRHDHCCCM